MRLAAIVCGADGIDSDGGALPFEDGRLQKIGSELGLEAGEIEAEIESARGGLAAVSAVEWESLRSISSDEKNAIAEKLASAAGADGHLSGSEGDTISIIRSKLGT